MKQFERGDIVLIQGNLFNNYTGKVLISDTHDHTCLVEIAYKMISTWIDFDDIELMEE